MVTPRSRGTRAKPNFPTPNLHVPQLRVVSLFAGIGGFDHAFEGVGAKVVFQCESDRYCQSVLKRHWPTATLNGDIRTLSAQDIPDAEIWTAGFPCQDVSLARGNHGRNGLKGNHTSLFYKLIDLAAEKSPNVILLENVVGLLNSHNGLDFALILRALTRCGYAVSWRVMNARYFGAPQSRARVFICAWKGDVCNAIATLFEPVSSIKLEPERLGFTQANFHGLTCATVPTVAYCVAATSGRHTGNDWSRSYISYPDAVRRPTPTESERLQGFPAGWTVPDDDFTTPARGLDSERYKAVGNAVAVPVAHWIARRLTQSVETSAIKRPPQSRSELLDLAPDLRRAATETSFQAIEQEVEASLFEHRWKTGGFAYGDAIVEGTASPAPSTPIPSSFVDVLDEDVPDERYFLTPNAAAGILRRAKVVGRNLFPPMHKALENLVRVDKAVVVSPSGHRGDQIAQSSIHSLRSQQRRTLSRPSPIVKRRIPA